MCRPRMSLPILLKPALVRHRIRCLHCELDLTRFCSQAWRRSSRQFAVSVLNVHLNSEIFTLLFAGVELEKSQTFSDWSAAVFTRAQIDYAKDDVRHLLAVRDKLQPKLETLGRTDW